MNIKIITSAANEKIKFLKKLQKKSARLESGRFIVENITLIHDALRAGFRPEALFITGELLQKPNDKLNYIIKNTGACTRINERVNKSFSTLAAPAGIAAVFAAKKQNINYNRPIAYLNAISDPGNLGTILRSALAFNIPSVVVDEECADIYNPKTINAAKDAIFKVAVIADNDRKILREIKNKMKVYAAVPADGVDIKTLPNEKFCVVLGNESNGVNEEILSRMDGAIKINTGGRIESLNVAVAAGIIFYEMGNKE